MCGGKLDDIDITVDGGKWYDLKVGDKTTSDQSLPSVPPIFGWKPFPSRPIPSNFNYGHIYHYLLESVVLVGEDGKAEDTDLAHMTSKPLTKGEQYVKSGSVTKMMDSTQGGNYYLKAQVDASMRNEQRMVTVTLSSISGAVRDASCTCPGSALGRCNHVAAVLLQLDKHCKEVGHDHEKTCTSKPCEWNKGKKAKNPKKITEAAYTYYKEKRMKLCDFDPRPSNFQQCDEHKMNDFLTSLKYSEASRGKKSMWQTLLEYKYYDYELSDDRKGILKSQVWTLFTNLKEACKTNESDIFMIPGTESQSDSVVWKASRWFRITVSTAKQANNLGSLLTSSISDTVLRRLHNFVSESVWELHHFTSPDMLYGIENEDTARNDYVKYMRLKNPLLSAEKTRFWVNSLWPELGCSPDGLVTDPSEDDKHGLLEIKCHKIFRRVAPTGSFQGHRR